jgi:hypothetical protein
MKGNGWRDRDQQIDPWDAIEGAIAAKLESGYAEETCFGFAATVANATPPVDEEFRRTLRASIVAEANQDLKEKNQMNAIQNRRRFPNRWKLALGGALAAVALVAVLITSTPIATAMKEMVIGYIDGIGLVEEDPSLRILAEPATMTRDGFTVEVDRALLYGDRTVIHYQVEGADTYPFAEPGDDICLEYAHLRLPDGSTLQPEPMGDGKTAEAGYEFATSFAAPIPPDVSQATLIIPCLLDSVRGTAPENWELDLSFAPAPQDMELDPVHDTAQTATDRGVTVDLEHVVAEEDGVIFNFSLRWNRGGEETPTLYPGSLYVTDASGQRILLSRANGRPPMPQNGAEPFAFRTSETPAPGPLTLKLDTVRAAFPMHDASFIFDPGSNPQPDQTWTLDEHFSIAGYEWVVTSARMIVQDGGPNADDVEGFEFTMESVDPATMMSVQLLDTAHPLATCEPGYPGGADFSSTLTYDNGVPAGPVTVTVSEASVLIPGEWEVRWTPSAE